MFLGLLANEGNYVGSVMFSSGVNKKTNITAIKGNTDKNKIENDIEMH